jgi:alpha-L-rhamnosidase
VSFNHYSAGAVIGFLRRYIDGICLGEEPAYRIFNVEPVFGGGLTATSVMHDLPYVRIKSSWRIEGGTLHLEAVVPPETTATVALPGRPSETRVGPGRHTVDARIDATTESAPDRPGDAMAARADAAGGGAG